MKRTVALILAVVLLLGGCSLRDSLLPSQQRDVVMPKEEYLADYQDKWAYTCLSREQKTNYGAVYTAVRDGFDTDEEVMLASSDEEYIGINISLPNPLSSKREIQELYRAFVQDSPEFFYISNAYGYSGSKSGSDRQYDTLTLTYTVDADKRADVQEELERERDELLGMLTPSMTDYEIELTLHDALLERCDYNDAAVEAGLSEEMHPHSFSAYGALVEGSAVCEGYAHAMQYLLNAAGIPATVVSGYDVDGIDGHMWNAVRLDGELYYLDPTWNDAAEIITYGYFNLTTEQMLCSHRFDGEALGLETATATAYNYHWMNGTYLDTVDQRDVAECVAERLKAGEDTVHLRFSPETFDEALLFVENASWFCETVNACLPSSAQKLRAYYLVYEEKQNTVTISKKTS